MYYVTEKKYLQYPATTKANCYTGGKWCTSCMYCRAVIDKKTEQTLKVICLAPQK